MIYLRRTLVAILLLAALVWTGDWLLLRLKMLRANNAYGSVEVHHRYAVHLKNKRIEQYTEKPHREQCVRSLFPHLDDSPCWYLEKHALDVQELDGAPWHFYYQ
jgi:hypothetical protein